MIEEGALQLKRGRPPKSQSKVVENAILDAARGLFFKQGFSGTPMEAIAASAGVAKATLYARFPTKHDLFRAIARTSLAQTGSEALGLDQFEGSLPDFLYLFGVTFLRGLGSADARSFHRLITSEQWFFPELAAEFFEHQCDVNIRLANKIVLIDQSPDRPIQNASRVAEIFIGALIGWFRTQIGASDPPDDQCNAFVTSLVNVVLGGRAAW